MNMSYVIRKMSVLYFMSLWNKINSVVALCLHHEKLCAFLQPIISMIFLHSHCRVHTMPKDCAMNTYPNMGGEHVNYK